MDGYYNLKLLYFRINSSITLRPSALIQKSNENLRTQLLPCSSDDPHQMVCFHTLMLYLCFPLGDLVLHTAALRVHQWFITHFLVEGMYLSCYNKLVINSCHSDNENLKSLSTTESNASLGISLLWSNHGEVLKIEAEEAASLINTLTSYGENIKK